MERNKHKTTTTPECVGSAVRVDSMRVQVTKWQRQPVITEKLWPRCDSCCYTTDLSVFTGAHVTPLSFGDCLSPSSHSSRSGALTRSRCTSDSSQQQPPSQWFKSHAQATKTPIIKMVFLKSPPLLALPPGTPKGLVLACCAAAVMAADGLANRKRASRVTFVMENSTM